MGTALKTICFPLPPLASITDAVAANFAQITVDLPESSKVFKKVWVEAGATDLITLTGGTIGEWRLGVQLGASGYTTVSNTNDITHSGENMAPWVEAEFTSHFTTYWSGSSMTFDLQIYLDQTTGTTFNFTNGWALLWVTYEYDDTSSTMVENAWIPFTSLTGALGTSKGTAQDTVPALDSFLGYGSISYKHIMVLAEGNECNNAGVTDFALTCQIDTYTAQVGGSHEAALASDRYVHEHYNMMSGGSPLFTTNATHSIYWWVSTGAVGRMHHAALTMLVVFTFDATSANDGNRSLLLAANSFNLLAGGTTSSDYTRLAAELMIEEPTTITLQKSAMRVYWSQTAALATGYIRAGSQSFQSYTDAAAMNCGGCVVQRTIDDGISLARGRNTIATDVYRSDASNKFWGMSVVIILNYKCGKPTGGWGKANRTVHWPLYVFGANNVADEKTVSATAPGIPETSYYLSNVGAYLKEIMSGTSGSYGWVLAAEKTSGEGNVDWLPLQIVSIYTDSEIGERRGYTEVPAIFRRYPNDPTPGLLDLETSRRWQYDALENPINAFCSFGLLFTYHAITFTKQTTVSGESGGDTVNLRLVDKADYKEVLTGSRVGNGTYDWTWYDSTRTMFIEAVAGSGEAGRSEDFTFA